MVNVSSQRCTGVLQDTVTSLVGVVTGETKTELLFDIRKENTASVFNISLLNYEHSAVV